MGSLRLALTRACRGFSLVEIAIVLVVVGLIVSGGLMGVAPVVQGNKVTQANQQLDKVEQALVLYVIQNGCLPCPASPSAVTGQAQDTTGTYSSNCGNGVACKNTQGLVPWVNLGLAKSDVIDPFGSFIDYAPASGLNTSSTSMLRTPPATYPVGNLSVQDAAGNAQTSTAAYVLISHGIDGSGGFTASAVSGGSASIRPDPNSSTLQTDNTAKLSGGAYVPQTTFFVQNQALGRASSSGYFDDLVRFKTGSVIVQSCGTNACGNPA